jgi:CRISPR-associated protein Csm5
MKQIYKVTLTTLSPVFIGDGNSIDKSEYLYDKINRQVIVFKRKDLLTGLMQIGLLDKYCDAVLKQKFNLTNFFYSNNVKPAQYNKWISHHIDSSVVIDDGHSLKNILCFIKDAYGVPYIPGSSLKGAIRTAMLNSNIAKINLDYDKNQVMQTYNYKNKADLRKKVNSIETKAFNTLGRKPDNTSNAVNDIFSNMLISDSEPIENCKLILCDKVDVTLKGEEKSVSTVVRECLPPNTKIIFTMTIDTKSFRIENIKGCIVKRFESYHKNYLDYFYKADVDKYTTANNIVIGGGAGFQSKTITYELLGKDKGLAFTKEFMCANFRKGKHDNDKTISPHTRKTAEYDGKLYDMGVCSIDFEKIG